MFYIFTINLKINKKFLYFSKNFLNFTKMSFKVSNNLLKFSKKNFKFYIFKII